MRFAEYVQIRDQELQEGNWNPAKFAIAGLGNAGYQAMRGLGNLGVGVGQTGLGYAQAGLGTAKGLAGGGWDTAQKGVNNIATGAARGLGGAFQTVSSPFAGLGRGLNAARQDGYGKPEEIDPGKMGSFRQFMGITKKPKSFPDQQNPAAAPEINQPQQPSQGFVAPEQVNLNYGRIENVLHEILMKKNSATPPHPAEEILKVLKNYSRRADRKIMKWDDFVNLANHYKVSYKKLYSKINDSTQPNPSTGASSRVDQAQPTSNNIDSNPQSEIPDQIKLHYGRIGKAIDNVSMNKDRQQMGTMLQPTEEFLKLLQSKSKSAATHVISRDDFFKLSRHFKVDPEKLYSSITNPLQSTATGTSSRVDQAQPTSSNIDSKPQPEMPQDNQEFVPPEKIHLNSGKLIRLKWKLDKKEREHGSIKSDPGSRSGLSNLNNTIAKLAGISENPKMKIIKWDDFVKFAHRHNIDPSKLYHLINQSHHNQFEQNLIF